MRRYKKRRYLYLTVVFTLFTCIGIGYAVLSSSFSITATVPLGPNTWDVHFENVRINSSSVTTYGTPTISGNTTLNTSVTLTYPGDQYEFYVDVVNSGTIDARLDSITKTALTSAQQKYLSYTVYYAYNEPLKQFDLLSANSKETLRIVIKYNSDTSLAPTTTQNLSLKLELKYVQDNGEGVQRKKLCHRAKTLHTGKKADGTTNITFGQLGTKGTLRAGDAFDCDVNGDNRYDAATERFYYVTDLDNDTAVLIYYINTGPSGGSIANRAPYYNSNFNTTGPLTAVSQLPTNWTRVGLKNPRRQITNQNNGRTVTISGSDRKAIYDLPVFYYQTPCRLITRQEYISISSSSNPYYLFENTPYVQANNGNTVYYWLDTPYSSGNTIYVQNSQMGSTTFASPTSFYGVRPVIEVFKSDMIY